MSTITNTSSPRVQPRPLNPPRASAAPRATAIPTSDSLLTLAHAGRVVQPRKPASDDDHAALRRGATALGTAWGFAVGGSAAFVMGALLLEVLAPIGLFSFPAAAFVAVAAMATGTWLGHLGGQRIGSGVAAMLAGKAKLMPPTAAQAVGAAVGGVLGVVAGGGPVVLAVGVFNLPLIYSAMAITGVIGTAGGAEAAERLFHRGGNAGR